MSPADPLSGGSVFTVDIADDRLEEPRIAPQLRPANDQSFDVAVIEFEDDGTFTDPSQLQAATAWIAEVREHNHNGAIVVLFIHGWHHNASWNGPDKGDSHFRAFRRLLASLALRESERYYGADGGRRVVGLYIGWNGDPDSWWSRLPLVTHSSFWDRYETAERIGAGDDIREALRQITKKAKDSTVGGTVGQLVFTGHSMGGLILESAMLSLVDDRSGTLLAPTGAASSSPVQTSIRGPVMFPDAVISLNSAADSEIWKKIKSKLTERGVNKTAAGRDVRYSPPLLVSMTSTADTDTRDWWPRAKRGRFTVGHDATLFTHRLVIENDEVTCDPRQHHIDRGQNFHCLRTPEPSIAATPAIAVDLPIRERKGIQDWPPHRRYRLVPLGSMNEAEIIWNFQVPPQLVKDHNDIFNSRSGSMILALIQISGAVASLAEDWDDTWE